MKQELAQLAVKIRAYCGIDYSNNLANLELKLTRRLTELQISLEEYPYYLQTHPLEWEKLIEQITINETYFFRELPQLEEFQKILRQKAGKEIRIWCIPCSTGEEAYSLAILAKEIEMFTKSRVKIIASDVNKKVLEHARAGVYSKTSLSFRRFPQDKDYLKRYFKETETGFAVKDEIKQMVTFEPFNLSDYEAYQKYKGIDMIFCRNVLFYFNDEINKKIINAFYSILKEDGYLFLGHAESISNYKSKFIPVHTKDAFYYVKKEQNIPSQVGQH